MKKRIKKTSLFVIFFGLILLGISLYFGYIEYKMFQEGSIEFFNHDMLGIILGAVFGAVSLVIGLVWFFKHRPRYDRVTELKIFGRKIHARFVRKESTNYEIDNQPGSIIFLQEENGEQIFQTQPIFSEFSIKWLEEHLFDVYIDTTNSDNYYVDMEKHFGEPQAH